MAERAIRMEGTCKFRILRYHTGWFYFSMTHDLLPYNIGTGEHGVGIGKREYLYSELGEGTVELMRLIKKTIDPLGLFNPGKVSVSQPVNVEPSLLWPDSPAIAIPGQEHENSWETLNMRAGQGNLLNAQ